MAAARTVFIDKALSNYASLAAQYAADLFNVVLLDQASSGAEQIQNWLNTNDASSADINVVSGSDSVNGLFTPRVVFVDPSVANIETVIAGVPANVTVVVLDASRDGVQQIHDFLSANAGQVAAIDIITDLASVDVIAHGSPGEVMLGSTVLSAANLANYSSQLAAIGSHLTAGADVLLYGCDVASGTAGQDFISALAAATGADVAASTDLTGSAAAGGDWVLEASTGTIDTAALNIADYEGVLAVTSIGSVKLSADTGVSSTDFITDVPTQTVTGTFTLNNNSTPVIWVSADGGATRTQATITHTAGTSSGSFSANVTLVTGSNTSLQFWGGERSSNQLGAPQVYKLDTTPTTTVSTIAFSNDSGASSTDFITNAAAQTISGTLSANTMTGQVVRVSLDNGLSWQTASSVVGQNTFSLSGVTLGGSNTLKVRVEDAAGNAGPVRTQAFVLDTVAPTAGAMSLSGLVDSGATGDGMTNDRTFDLSLAGNEAGSSVTYEVSINGAAFSSTHAAQTNLADGSYQFRARVTDVAGNTATTNTVSVKIDATAPNAPSITGFSDNSGSALDTTTTDQTPTLTITAEADSTVEVFNGGVSIGTATQTAPGSGIYTFTSSTLADGIHSFTAKATDAAGNSSSASPAQNVVVDTSLTAPTVALTTDSGTAGDGLTNDGKLTLNTADSDATRFITVDGTAVNSYDASTLVDGEHTVSVVDTDGAGNTKNASITFTLDTTLAAPTVALTTDSGTAGDGVTNLAGLTFNEADSDAVRVIMVDGTVVNSYNAGTLGDGEHTVSVVDTDGAGNTKNASVTFTLDTSLTAPTVALTADSGMAGDRLTNDGKLTFNTADSDAARVITVDGTVVNSYDASTLGDGEHTVSVVDTDGAGNTKNASVTFTLDTSLTAPTVALTTDSGVAGDGVTNLAGLNFNEVDSDAVRVIKVDGTVVNSYDASTLADGEHTVSVADTDGAGNIKNASVAFTLDTGLTAPTVALTTDSGTAGDGLTNDGKLTFNTADSDATRVIKVDGAVVNSYDASTLADGEHTISVVDTDGAGNTKNASVTFTLDTKLTAPTVALTTDSGTAGDGLTNDAKLTLNAADSDATRVITVDGTVMNSYDASTLGDGEHTVSVVDTDGAGNTKNASVTFTLDTKLTAPTVALTTDSGTAGDGLTNDAKLTLNTADSDATRVITVDGEVVNSYDASTLADGEHTVSVVDTDGAGNTKNASVTFTLDTKLTAPTVALTTDSGTPGDGLTNDATLTLNTADSDATRVITVDGTVVNSYDASTLADGEHTVSVADTDGAGNTKNASVTFTVDTLLTAPTVALTTDSGEAGDRLTNDAKLTLNTVDGDATRVITVDGTVVNSYDASTLADGEHTVSVVDTDGAGNTKNASVTFTLDTSLTAPTVALTTDSGTAGDRLTNDGKLAFNTADSDATRVITVDGTVVNSYNASSLADGEHTVSVVDTDGAGNTKNASITFTIDTLLTAPTVALTTDSGTSGDGLTNDAKLTLNTADSDATRVITVDGTVVNSYDSSTLADGEHTVSVVDTDGAGNTKNASVTFTLDTKLTAPTVALTTDSGTPGDGLTNDATLTLNTADSDATRVITMDGTVVNSYDASTLADGEHTVSVADTDGAGNTKNASVTFTVDTLLTAPTVALTTDSGEAGDRLTNDAKLTLNTVDGDAMRVITVDGTVVNSYDASTLADGEHTVNVVDTDGAGNTKNASVTFTLDTLITSPTVALTTDSGEAGDRLTNDAKLTLNTADSDATRVITVDGIVVNSYNASTLADGEHTVSVVDTDGAGNTKNASVTFTLDTSLTAPTVELTTDSGTAGDRLTNDGTLTFNTADSDAVRVITVDGEVVNSYDASILTDGEHTVSVVDTDQAGNSKSLSSVFTLDTEGPAFTSGASARVAENIGANQIVYRAQATDVHSIAYRLDGTDANKFEISTAGVVTLKDNPNFESTNAYSFSVVATDAAGNHTSKAVSLGIDNVNEAPVASPVNRSTIENTSVTLQVADFVYDQDAGDTLALSLSSNTVTLAWANSDPNASTQLINPVTRAPVAISSLTVQAQISADGTSITLVPPAELDWLSTGQAVKATFNYTVTDAGGLTSSDSISLLMSGSTNDRGVNLNGGNGNDTLSGNTTNNAEDVLQGANGNDTLSGYGGTDALYGGNGDDKLSGGAGIDYLYGDSGNDTLDGGTEGDFIFGGKGNDILTGGTGADKFVFDPQNGNDRIVDFNIAQGDKLFFADFFATPMSTATFLSKYVTDTGNDLLIELPGTTLVLVGVASIGALSGAISFGMPA